MSKPDLPPLGEDVSHYPIADYLNPADIGSYCEPPTPLGEYYSGDTLPPLGAEDAET